MKILMVDNYDSFTFNLVQYLGEMGVNVIVKRNNEITIAEIEKMKPNKIVISPGPCTPKEAGISNDILKNFAGKIPILGVCLGHQCIGYVFGGNVIRAKKLMHGKTSLIYHNEKTIFKDLENPFEATRYHSLIIERESIPDCLEITAETKEKEIMAVRHKKYSIEGVQFHPESILTKEGKKLLKNFVMM